MTGEEMFDDLCRKAGLPTTAENLAAIHRGQIEDLLGRWEWERDQEAQEAAFWANITIARPR